MGYSIKSRIWIEKDGKILLGEGRVNLLRAVGEHGSISAAAKSLGMSYKKAWSLLDAVNARADQPVISSSIGGAGGGGAKLTAYGEKLISAFDRINGNCWDYLDEQIKNSNL